MICQRLTPHLVDPVQVSPDFTLLSMLRCRLRWDPWYQGTRAPEPWALVPGIFFYFFFIFYFGGSSFFLTKNRKKYCFLSVFSLFLSLFLSFSVHTLRVLLSLITLRFADAFASASKVCLSLVMCPGFLSTHTPLVTD
jgi:hypothetical protein